MITLWLNEECPDCGYDREREHLEQLISAGMPIPKGWRLVERRGSWKTIRRATRFTTLCECDAV